MSALATDHGPASVADCDQALRLLHGVLRDGAAAEKLLAWEAVDEVLDRRNDLVLEAARMGAQS